MQHHGGGAPVLATSEMGLSVEKILVRLVATGLGAGRIPVAPGTAGTLIGVPLFVIFSQMSWQLHLLSILALSFLAAYVSGEAEKLLNRKDAPSIVIDEIVGFQFTMLLISPTLPHIVLGFIAFRIFDITKPFPIRLCERKIPGGWGVVADDIMAGLYGHMVLTLLLMVQGAYNF